MKKGNRLSAILAAGLAAWVSCAAVAMGQNISVPQSVEPAARQGPGHSGLAPAATPAASADEQRAADDAIARRPGEASAVANRAVGPPTGPEQPARGVDQAGRGKGLGRFWPPVF